MKSSVNEKMDVMHYNPKCTIIIRIIFKSALSGSTADQQNLALEQASQQALTICSASSGLLVAFPFT